MHPDFWLVLLRFLRPLVLALLGTAPGFTILMVFAVPFLQHRSDLASVFPIGAGLVVAALPPLAPEELSLKTSRFALLRAFAPLYLCGVIPALSVLLAVNAIVPIASHTMLDRVLAVAVELPLFSLSFALTIGVPLWADRISRDVDGRRRRSIVVTGLLSMLSAQIAWSALALTSWLFQIPLNPTPWSRDATTNIVMLLFIGLWPINLEAARIVIDRVIDRIRARAEAADEVD